jgi:hypothetical protein
MRRTYQRVYMSDGTTIDVPLAGTAHYETGDGHHHWHFDGALTGFISDPANHVVRVAYSKIGFCFLDDNTIPGTIQAPATYTRPPRAAPGTPPRSTR